MSRDRMTPELEHAFRAGLTAALQAGHGILADGGGALDAVEATIRILEDDPLFNAGRGAVFTHEGGHALDASIMDGRTGQAGAVAGVCAVKNPISLARLVMERSPHVLLMGEGAEAFARLNGMDAMPLEYYHTAERWAQYQRALAREAVADDQGTARDTFQRPAPGTASAPEQRSEDGLGTVGAVALDRAGHLAAGTSTGGMTNKRWGRIGDSAVIGAGTFADDECAVGGTGWGEYFLRNVVAHDVCARKRYGGVTLAEAAHQVVLERLEKQAPRTGGVIGIDREGHVVWTHNTPGMYRGYADQEGRTRVAIYRDEG